MVSRAHSEQYPEPVISSADRALRLAIKEQLEGAREASFTPMAMLCVNLLGSSLQVELGVTPEQATVISESVSTSKLLSITDARSDPRAPVSSVSHALEAFLVAPVSAEGRPLGFVCVMDSRARDFTESQVEALVDIAYIIGKRIERFLGPEREERRESLMRRAVSPAFAELRNALVPLSLGTADLKLVSSDIEPLIQRIAGSEETEDRTATAAHLELVELTLEINRAAERVREVVMVVEGLWGEGDRSVALEDFLRTSAGLALHSTRLVGGVEMPKASAEHSIQARRSVAVAGLSLLLARAAEANASGITEVTALLVELECTKGHFYLRVSGPNLSSEECAAIAQEVDSLLLGDNDLLATSELAVVTLRMTRLS